MESATDIFNANRDGDKTGEPVTEGFAATLTQSEKQRVDSLVTQLGWTRRRFVTVATRMIEAEISNGAASAEQPQG